MPPKCRKGRKICVDIIIQVPEEISDLIFRYLTWSDLVNCHCVSRQWRRQILDTTAWKYMCEKEGFKVSDYSAEHQGSPVSCRELFFKLKYRVDNWETQLSRESVTLTCARHRESVGPKCTTENGVLAYVSPVCPKEVCLYDFRKKQVRNPIRIVHTEVDQMFLYDNVLILVTYRESDDMFYLSTWCVESGQVICENYTDSGEHVPRTYKIACDRKLNVLAGRKSSEKFHITGIIRLWNLGSGQVLLSIDLVTTSEIPSTNNGLMRLCYPVNHDEKDKESFILIWGNFRCATLHFCKICTKTYKELGRSIIDISSNCSSDQLYIPPSPASFTVYKGNVRLLIQRLITDEEYLDLGGKEIKMCFKTDEQNVNKILLENTASVSQYNYVGSSIKADEDKIIYFIGAGDVYEIISYSYSPREYDETDNTDVYEIYKIAPHSVDEQARHRTLMASIPVKNVYWMTMALAELSWLDGLDGHNDKRLFLVTLDPDKVERGSAMQQDFTLISWKNVRLKQRSSLHEYDDNI